MEKVPEEKIKKEIEFLKYLSDYYSFEQNHILNDYMPRIISLSALTITISLALLHFGYWFLGLLFFAIGTFEMSRRFLVLKRDRDKILYKRLRISAEISRRYELLGINVQEFWRI